MIIDSAPAFANAIRMLYNIDRDVLEDAGIVDSEGRWEAFRSNPPRFVMRADDPTMEKLWALMETRQRK